MLFTISTLLFLLSLLSSALAASPKYYLSVVGQKTGNIYHNNITSFANVVPITNFNFSITSPRDAASGLATGKILPHPVDIEKEMDGNTPSLLNMAVTNENIVHANIIGVEAASNGRPATTFVWKLTNANIANLVHEGRDGMMVERFSMTYMKLEVDATASGTTITADFDWL